MNKNEIYGIARALFSAAGGFFVARGYVDSETAVAVAGALATIIVAVWSVKDKRA
jgi:hypothetical protein